MGDRSNVGHRVLNPVKSVKGTSGSLENFIGLALVDGAECFVLDEQANYRWLASSTLVPDGRFVVLASGPQDQGRWVREAGLVGFAQLLGGKCSAWHDMMEITELVFSGYDSRQLVQFEMLQETTLVYAGSVPRVAMFSAHADLRFDLGWMRLGIHLEDKSGFTGYVAVQTLERAGSASAAGSMLISPGAQIVLRAHGPKAREGMGSLCVMLA